MNRRVLGFISGTGIVIGMMMTGCETIPPRQGTAIDEIGAIVSAGASQAIQPVQPPAEVTDALMPEVTVSIPEVAGGQIDQGFDIATNDMPAKQFFMSLVDGTQFNVIPHPDVEGNITLHLKNVTVVEVMNIVRDIYGYDYEIKGNVIQVKANNLQAHIFHVNYLSQKRSGSSEMIIQSGSTGTGINGEGGSSSGTSGSTIATQSEIDLWKDIENSLKLMLAGKEGRTIVVNPTSGLVIVRALPNELNDVEKFLNSVQNIAARQVILEAKILEVELSDGFQTGINWAALGRPANGQTITGSQIGGGSVINNGVSDIAGTAG
ncbi:MAG TPA: secretin N-terminal domain-containing protein, partial [Gammaproteobacteria bacterium]